MVAGHHPASARREVCAWPVPAARKPGTTTDVFPSVKNSLTTTSRRSRDFLLSGQKTSLPRGLREFRPPRNAYPRYPPSDVGARSEEHTSELQSLMRTSYAVSFLHKKIIPTELTRPNDTL